MYKKYIKQWLDILFSLLVTPFAFIALGICAVIIKLVEGGPVFYCSNRLGKNGRIFKMYKLRTMKTDAPDLRNKDGSTFNSEDDPRVTQVGRILRKTSLDELPQIFNVLKREMSFIGPRPDLPEHINCYTEESVRKLEVMPGISGYNQAFFRNSIEWEQRLKNDIFYVNNISLMLDAKIFFATILSVFSGRRIYPSSAMKDSSNCSNKFKTELSKISEKPYEVFKLDWDTDFFNILSAKVVLKEGLSERGLKDLVGFLEAYEYEFVTIMNTNNNSTNNFLLGTKSDAFLVDFNVQFIKTVSPVSKVSHDYVYILEAYNEIPGIIELAAKAFKYSRFINDPWLPEDNKGKVYKHWVESAFNKPNRYFSVAERNQKVLGFLLFSIDLINSTSIIELIAVDENLRGNHIGKSLIAETEAYLTAQGISKIKVGTQGDNTSAIRLYTSYGFKYESCNTIYHYWPHKKRSGNTKNFMEVTNS